MKYAVLGAAVLVSDDSGLQVHGFASKGAVGSTDNGHFDGLVLDELNVAIAAGRTVMGA